MHNLAIALHKKGFDVTGSDDEIRDPSRSRLDQHGLLPATEGWHPEKISDELDAIILGMHARKDNPELIKAQELGVHVYSYPEYLYSVSQDKTRLVIAGSHGKTTITSMILHALQAQNMEFDYMVGAQLEGFDTMVGITDAPIMVLEGDEYLSSPIDRRSKFLHYKPHATIISGIAWDHINVFPDYDGYVDQFRKLISSIEPGGHLIYFKGDEELPKLAEEATKQDVQIVGYNSPTYQTNDQTTIVTYDGRTYELQVFGAHNLQNLEAAREMCATVGMSGHDFYSCMSTFTGAAKRMEFVAENEHSVVIKDFAHAPSKVKATVNGVREKYPDKRIVAVFELHTFSSLNKEFLPQYAGTLDAADIAMVSYDPAVVTHKKLPEISIEDVAMGFANENVQVFQGVEPMVNKLKENTGEDTVYLIMTSGGFAGIEINLLGNELLS